MTLGQNIARLRTQKNLSQGDLADALEVSRQSVSKWETDASIPELDKLLRLAELFGVTLDELVKGESAQPEAARGEAPDKESAGAYTAATPAARRETRQIVGTILLCFGALIGILIMLFAGTLAGWLAHLGSRYALGLWLRHIVGSTWVPSLSWPIVLYNTLDSINDFAAVALLVLTVALWRGWRQSRSKTK